jgi:hypothetical protein
MMNSFLIIEALESGENRAKNYTENFYFIFPHPSLETIYSQSAIKVNKPQFIPRENKSLPPQTWE